MEENEDEKAYTFLMKNVLTEVKTKPVFALEWLDSGY